MKKIMALVIGSVFVFSVLAVSADMISPSPYCTKPSKPYEFTDQWQVDSFNSEVSTFKSCIQNFIEEQNDAVRNHQNAAEEAISEWNSFVNYELN